MTGEPKQLAGRGGAGGGRGGIPMVRRWRLSSPLEQIPVGIRDREAAEVLWPLLVSGSSRIQLVGRLAVGLGIDTATASARVEGFIGALDAANLLSGEAPA